MAGCRALQVAMEALRRRIETQVMSLTGLALGQLDLESPKGDPACLAPTASVGRSTAIFRACWSAVSVP